MRHYFEIVQTDYRHIQHTTHCGRIFNVLRGDNGRILHDIVTRETYLIVHELADQTMRIIVAEDIYLD